MCRWQECRLTVSGITIWRLVCPRADSIIWQWTGSSFKSDFPSYSTSIHGDSHGLFFDYRMIENVHIIKNRLAGDSLSPSAGWVAAANLRSMNDSKFSETWTKVIRPVPWVAFQGWLGLNMATSSTPHIWMGNVVGSIINHPQHHHLYALNHLLER